MATMKYFQTWMYVSRMRRIPVVGKLLYLVIQFFCGIKGHEPSRTEWGYGGGDYADRWCRWCDKHIIVPKDSIRFAFKEHAHMMNHIEDKLDMVEGEK
jgi:hypothetical protein